MANVIVMHTNVLKKGDKSKINLAAKKQEVSMDSCKLDIVTAKERLSTPLRFRLYQLKTWFSGLFSSKGVTI